jgi:hypothetical protein
MRSSTQNAIFTVLSCAHTSYCIMYYHVLACASVCYRYTPTCTALKEYFKRPTFFSEMSRRTP